MTATLASLVDNNYGLRVFCHACGHCADLDVNALVSRHGDTMPLPEIGDRARCKSCDGKGGSVQVVAVTG